MTSISNQERMNRIRSLHPLARARDGAFPTVDATHTVFLGRLGHIENMQSAWRLDSESADAARAKLLTDHIEFVQRIAEAKEGQLHSVLNPPVPTAPPVPRDRQVADLLAALTAKGIRFFPDYTGRIVASPASSMTMNERQQLSELRVEVTAEMRRDLFVIEAETEMA